MSTAAPPSDGLPPIPRPLLEQAQAEDLTEPEIVRAWRDYVTWHRKTYGDAPWRQKDWDRQIDWACRDKVAQADAVRLSSHAALSPRELEQALAEEVYLREACTFGEWIDRLMLAHQRGELLSPEDASFLAWREEQGASSPRAWGMTAILAYGEDVVNGCAGRGR